MLQQAATAEKKPKIKLYIVMETKTRCPELKRLFLTPVFALKLGDSFFHLSNQTKCRPGCRS